MGFVFFSFLHNYLKSYKSFASFSLCEVGEFRLDLLNFLPSRSPTSVFELSAHENGLFLWKT